MAPTLVSESATLKALVRLSFARGAGKFEDKEMQRAYLDGLSDLQPDNVRLACEELAREAKPEFGPAMPTVGDIRQRVSMRLRLIAERQQTDRLLAWKRPEMTEEQIARSDERRRQMFRSLREMILTKSFPGKS